MGEKDKLLMILMGVSSNEDEKAHLSTIASGNIFSYYGSNRFYLANTSGLGFLVRCWSNFWLGYSKALPKVQKVLWAEKEGSS